MLIERNFLSVAMEHNEVASLRREFYAIHRDGKRRAGACTAMTPPRSRSSSAYAVPSTISCATRHDHSSIAQAQAAWARRQQEHAHKHVLGLLGLGRGRNRGHSATARTPQSKLLPIYRYRGQRKPTKYRF